MLFLIFVKNNSPTACFYYGSPEKLMIESEYTDDKLYARSPSLISSFGEINQISIAVQVTTITSHTTLEASSLDTVNNEIQMKIKEIE
jgi:hypothetical protein